MLAILVTVAHTAEPVDIALRGVCDGSTAVSVRETRLIVAYDEDRSLHSYAMIGGDSLGEFSLDEALGLEGEREYDLEASVHVGDTIWWLGSHGLNKDGKDRPSRRVLFSTNAPQMDDLSDLTLTRKAIDLWGVVGKKLSDEVLARPPKEGGLNLEGLEVHPDGGFLVGMRSPLTSEDGMTGKATVLRLLPQVNNDDSVSYRVKSRTRLDLGDRGIRSLAKDGDSYLILAGPVGFGGPFDIYRWNGRSKGATPLGVNLAGLNPEALVHVQGDRWLVLSDDGAVRRFDADSSKDDGMRECKDIRKKNRQGAAHPSVYARGRLISLP